MQTVPSALRVPSVDVDRACIATSAQAPTMALMRTAQPPPAARRRAIAHVRWKMTNTPHM